MTRQNILQKVRKGMEESGHSVNREIMWDLEKFGIYPAFSINGKIQTLKFAPKSDLEKCADLKTDFWFAVYYQNNKKLSSPIIVISKKTGKLKEYKNITKFRWIKEFTNDLKKGFYN